MDGSRPLMGYSIVTERYRLTRWLTREASPAQVALELYDRETDAGETHNAAGEPRYLSIQAELTARLAAGWAKARPQP